MSETERQNSRSAYHVGRLSFRYPHDRVSQFGNGNGWALSGVTFEVLSGEILGVIGPNGSGKTSLLKLLARVLRPQGGEIHLFGSRIGGMPQEAIARLVALVPQESRLIFPFTIAETVMMGRFPHRRNRGRLFGVGLEGPEDIRLAIRAMKETDVVHLAHRSIEDVSGGERQRAIIARALAQEPKVLLLDEPTAFLDLNHQLEICAILTRLNKHSGLTVILASHDLNLASQYCDRLLLLNEGEIFRMGTPEEIIRPEVLEAVYRCRVLVDRHPVSGLPRVTLPGRARSGERMADS